MKPGFPHVGFDDVQRERLARRSGPD